MHERLDIITPKQLRREHPHLKVMIVEDGLASNFPHLSLLNSLNMEYIKRWAQTILQLGHKARNGI